ncbi:hypothetical protein [Nonomuraea diastatica]|uniref:hypothetical protein n=1 Tax=Nonomuraea diastatica TaxID=1848329 RepID=UPI001C70AD14|nr:hypothetical protein [Nonomuraea diastatica]
MSLIAFRAVQAVGAGLFYPQVLAVLQTVFTGRTRATAFAVFGATIRLLPSGRASGIRSGLDLTGVGLLSGALLFLSVPLVEGQHAGWPVWTWISLGASVPTLAAFVAWERRLAVRGGSPLVDPALFRLRAFASGNAIALAFFAGNAGLFFVLTLQLQNGMGYSPLAAGLIFVPLAAAFAAASLLGPRIQAVLGHHALTLGYAINAAGTLALLVTAWAAGTGATGWILLPALAVIGFGEGLGVSPLIGTVLTGVPAVLLPPLFRGRALRDGRGRRFNRAAVPGRGTAR